MRKPLARRTFLRGLGQGAGVAVALPLLEAMIPTSLFGSSEATAAAEAVKVKNRFILLYYPNGIHTPNWYPQMPEDFVGNGFGTPSTGFAPGTPGVPNAAPANGAAPATPAPAPNGQQPPAAAPGPIK